MIINCPECGKEISDKAEICIGCGFPIKKYLENEETKNNERICPYCGSKNLDKNGYCDDCGMKQPIYQESHSNKNIDDKKEGHKFSGIYRNTLLGGLQEVYCPRCGSENCSHYQEQKIIPGKTKTKYTVNLNPFKPFTLVNKKEKVIKKDEVVTVSKFVCNRCGKIFI